MKRGLLLWRARWLNEDNLFRTVAQDPWVTDGTKERLREYEEEHVNGSREKFLCFTGSMTR